MRACVPVLTVEGQRGIGRWAVRVYDREGVLQAVSEAHVAPGTPLAWRYTHTH
jgi:hypothetical protein